MSARTALLVYLAAVVAATLVHDPAWLAAALGLALAAAGAQRWQLLRRAALAVLAFNLTVSLGYAVVAAWHGKFSADYLLLVNLRVLLLVFLGFRFAARGDLLQALAGWPLATLLATIALGQIKTFERLLRDFADAFASRNPGRPRALDRAHLAATQVETLLDKSLAASQEVALAMRSRGAFDD